MANKNTVSIGNAGEYFVAGELERRGFTAAVPMSNVKDFDILAIDRQTYKQFAIQVKTTAYKQKKWTLSQKCETLVNDDIIYFFVSLNEMDAPEYHIVPSTLVAKTGRLDLQTWPSTPAKTVQTPTDTTILSFSHLSAKSLNRWDHLGK